ncbi:MAG: DUF3014 domain-containing protein [Betaproteobacteria bacterium]
MLYFNVASREVRSRTSCGTLPEVGVPTTICGRSAMPTEHSQVDPEFTLADASTAAADMDARQPPASLRNSGRTKAIAIAAAFFLVAGAIYLFWPFGPPRQQVAMPAVPAAVSPVVDTQSSPTIQHPIEQVPAGPASDSANQQTPIPGLDGSDNAAKDAIANVLGGDGYFRLLVPTKFIRHIVATVDNLPRKKISVQIMPVVPVPGAFATGKSNAGIAIEAGNANRYAAYVTAAEAINATRLTQFYVRFYPLFQEAYAELGYPKGYFNDRVVEVIDHLLAAPESTSPIYVIQPKVLYEFADPALENLSAGQKIMVRIGHDNEMRLKAKLREIRKALTGKDAIPKP